MNRSGDNSTNRDNDSDIAQLFQMQRMDIPKVLDEVILSSAKAAVENTTDSASEQHSERRSKTGLAQYLGVAATLVIGFGVVSMLLHAPEHSLTTSDFDRLSPEAIATQRSSEPQSSPMSQSSTESASASANNISMNQAELAEENLAADSNLPSVPAVNENAEVDVAAAALMSSDSPNTNREIPSTSTTSHRSNVDSWLLHIAQLIGRGEIEAADKELRVFRQTHPEQEYVDRLDVLEDQLSVVPSENLENR